MDTRQLRTLVVIAERGTFAHAAGVVGLTPSAVSQQIQALESELDVSLFDRSSRPPKLTPQGLQVYETAKKILQIEAETKSSLKGERVAGTLMLGSVRSSALILLPKAIVQMRSLFPELKVNLRVSLSSSLISDVAAGRLDAAMVAEHVGVPHGLRWSPFLREPLWIIAPRDMDEPDPVRLLGSKPYVRFRSDVPLANMIDTEISKMGVLPDDVAEIDNIASIVTCVRQGIGVSVVPQVALEDTDGKDLRRLPFGKPQITRQIGIVERTVTPRGEIIAEMHKLLAKFSGESGVLRD